MSINTPNYKVIKFDLSVARTQEEFNMKGGFIGVKAINGDFFIQFDDTSQDPINLKLLPLIRTKFEKIYISNASQPSGYILFIIGRPCEFDASLGTINPQHANIGLPHQNIPSINPAPITRPTTLFPTPPPPIEITQIAASGTIQYQDNSDHHITTGPPIDIFTSTPLQTPLRGTIRISFHISNIVDTDIEFEIILLSPNNVRDSLVQNIVDHVNQTQPITVVRDIASRGYYANDKIVIHGNPVGPNPFINLVISDFKIMFDIV